MKRAGLVLGAILIAAPIVWLVGPFTFYASVVPILGPVLPRPPGVPTSAAASYDWKGSGMYWTWTRSFQHGCAAWMASDDYASVQLLVGSRCEGKRQTGYLRGRGLTHLSFEPHLTFRGYWPWSDADHTAQIVFDEKGMISSVRPCPYSLSEDQIAAMRLVADEAQAEAQTDAEKRVLKHVTERLSTLKGDRLASGQAGCTDFGPADRGSGRQRPDAWTGRSR